MWAVSRYADVATVLRSPDRFSSQGFRAAWQPAWVGHNPLASSILAMDGPDHARLRGLVSRAFGAPAIARIEQRARDLCERLARPPRRRGRLHRRGRGAAAGVRDQRAARPGSRARAALQAVDGRPPVRDARAGERRARRPRPRHDRGARPVHGRRHRGPQALALRRPRERARPRRRAPRRPRDHRSARQHPWRRPRDHDPLPRQLDAPARGAPLGARAAARLAAAHPEVHRRDDALRRPDAVGPPAHDAGRRAGRRDDPRGLARAGALSARRTATSCASRIPIGSICTAGSRARPSGTARTSALARPWPGWKRRPRSRCCSRGSAR